MEVYKTFAIEDSSAIQNLPNEHPCKRVHRHSFKIPITVEGNVNEDTGFVMDFAKIDSAFSPIHKMIDHTYLNDLDGLDNPSSENLCRWIWSKVSIKLNGLKKIEIKETDATGCIYNGEENGKT